MGPRTLRLLRAGLLASVFVYSLMVPAYAGFDVEAGIEEALERVLTLPLPMAIDPLVSAAMELDTIALSVANALLVRKKEEIIEEEIDAGGNRQAQLRARKRMRAVRRLQSIFSRLKREKERKERKEKEDGWDPFFAVLRADGQVNVPGANRFSLLSDGDEANESFSAIVRPVFGGDVDAMVKVRSASLEATIDASGKIDLTDLMIELASFDLSDGMPTGTNRIGRFTEHTNGVGTLDPASGKFEFRFEGKITNDLYADDLPILFFAHAQGVLDASSGELTVSADDPMLVPLPAGREVTQRPSWAAAVITSFDQPTGELVFRDPVNPTQAPHIALVRYVDGTYTVRRSADRAVGARLEIAPFKVRGLEAGRTFRFEDSSFILKDSDVLLRGNLVDIRIDGNTAEFFATLLFDSIDVDGSRLMMEFGSICTPVLVQLSTGVGALDLIEVTQGFTVSAVLPSFDLSHGTAGVLSQDGFDCPRRFVRGDTSSDGRIDIADGIWTLQFLFVGGPPPECAKAADADDTGNLDITDATLIFQWLFIGGPPPKEPSPDVARYSAVTCGFDRTPDPLDCVQQAEKCK